MHKTIKPFPILYKRPPDSWTIEKWGVPIIISLEKYGIDTPLYKRNDVFNLWKNRVSEKKDTSDRKIYKSTRKIANGI